MIFYVIMAATIALMPGASFILIPLEAYMIFQIAKKHGQVEAFEILLFITKLEVLSFFLKAAASAMHAIPIFGQFANSIVAAGFMYFIATLSEHHYLQRTGQSR